jgi:hypothetical protein
VLIRLMRRLVLATAMVCTAFVLVRTLRLRAEAAAPLPSDPWPRVPDEPEVPTP